MNETEFNQQPEQELIEIKDNSQRAKMVLIIFWVLIALTLAGLLTTYFQLLLFKRIQLGEYVSEEEAGRSDAIQVVMGIAQIGIYIFSIVVFLNWFRRAYGNLHRLAVRDLQHTETMSVWCWFIPIIGLFRPVKIMKEILE
jgi:O-antigen/teichoic acid export membrane protein